MRFAVDESGSFTASITAPMPPVSVAVTLVVPDDQRDSLLASFQSFLTELPPEAFKNGEPKGGRLTYEAKLRYCDMLAQHLRVLVCPVIVDLGHIPDRSAVALRDGLAHDMRELSSRSPKQDQQLLATVSDKIAKLSPPQAVRLYAWARSIFHSLYYAIRLPDIGDSLTEWDDREFLIDPVQDKPGSDEEIILGEMLSLWMAWWSCVTDARRSWAFEVPDETECLHHSFRHRFFKDDRIDLDALLSGRVRFDRASKNERLLQIADISASIIYRAARNPEPGSERVVVYESLARSCPYEPDFGIGLITPHQELAGSGIPNRFAALVAAMQRSYQTYRAMSGLRLPY